MPIGEQPPCTYPVSGSRSFCFIYSLDFRDDLTGFIYKNGIAYTKSQLVNEILIMQYCSGYGCACKQYRFKYCNRCYSTGTAYIYFYIKEFGLLFFRRILIGYRPSWNLGGIAQLLSVAVTVDFDYSAVNIISQVATVLSDGTDGIPHTSPR